MHLLLGEPQLLGYAALGPAEVPLAYASELNVVGDRPLLRVYPNKIRALQA